MSTLPSRPGPPIPDAIMVTTPSTATINSACDPDDYYEEDRFHPGGSSSLSVSSPPRSRRFALLTPPSDNDLSHYSQASALEGVSVPPKRRTHSATTSPQLAPARRAPPSPLKSSFNRNFQPSTPTVSSPNPSIPPSPTSPLHHWRTNSNGDRRTVSSISSVPSSRSSLPSSRGSSFPPAPVRKNSRQPESPSASSVSFENSGYSKPMPVLAPPPPPRPQRRKASSASQQSLPSQPRMSVASTTSVSTFASSYAPSLPPPPLSPTGSVLSLNQYASPLDITMPALPPKSPLRRPSKKSTSSFNGLLDMYDLTESKPVPLTPVPGMSVPPQYTSPYNQFVDEPMQMNYSWDGEPPSTARARPPERPLPRRPSMDSQRSVSDLASGRMVDGNQSVTSLGSLLTTSTTATSGSSGTAMGVTAAPSPAVAVPLQPDLDDAAATRKANKRKHALLELLSSERAYAADLALVKGIHIPLSKGLQPSFQPPEPSNASIAPSILGSGVVKSGPGGGALFQSTSRRSSNTNSTASSVFTTASISGGSTGPTSSSARSISNGSTTPAHLAELPMNSEASKIVFGNIEELAIFADGFSERLEMALGNVIEGGVGEDHVGELFLEMIPQMGPLYKTYITRHPTALAQFQSLPPCPALTAYVNLTKQLAASHTNAWDIPSLLIKPVQRLLKYPLLLGTIHSETPDDHPDKPKLQEAKDRIEEVARNVNEGRRRWEVVKGILTQGDGSTSGSLNSKEGSLIPGRGAAPPKMGRMRSFRSKIKPSLLEGPDRDKNAKEEMEMWEKKIKECEFAVKDLARDSLQWSREVRTSFAALKGWNSQFGAVVGLGESGIEAVGAFGKVVGGLLALWLDLDHTLQNILLPQLQKLVRTLSSPQILLAHMHTLHHSHVTLLNTPYNKSRPPNPLIEASNDYLALQATLREELPSFFALFEKGLTWILVEFSRWQARFWREVREHWLTFWIALAVEEEDQASGQINGIGSGSAETQRIWWERFEEVEQIVKGFRITNRPPRARKASGQPANGLYQHTNTSATSVQDSRSIRDLYLGMAQALSAHALPTASSPDHFEKDVFSDRHKERQSTHSLPTPSPRSPHKRRGSSAAESMRTMETGVIALNSMMPSAPASVSSPTRRSKSNDRDRQKEKEKAIERERSLQKEIEREKKRIREREKELEVLEMQRAAERIAQHPKKSMPPPPPPPPLPRRRSSKSNDRSRPVTPGVSKPMEAPAPRSKTPNRALSPVPGQVPLMSPVSPSYRDKRRDVSKEIDDDNISVKSSTRSLRRFAGNLFSSQSRPRSHSRSNSSPPPTIPTLPPTMPSLKSRPSAPAQLQIGEPRPAPRPPHKTHQRSMSTDNCSQGRLSHQDFLPHLEFEAPFAADAPFPSQLDPPPSPLYSCTTIVPFLPPHNIMYMSLPFMQLHVGDTIQVLVEAGHPSEHALPIFVDDGDDCLLVARDEAGRIGWTLASFVMPLV